MYVVSGSQTEIAESVSSFRQAARNLINLRASKSLYKRRKTDTTAGKGVSSWCKSVLIDDKIWARPLNVARNSAHEIRFETLRVSFSTSRQAPRWLMLWKPACRYVNRTSANLDLEQRRSGVTVSNIRADMSTAVFVETRVDMNASGRDLIPL